MANKRKEPIGRKKNQGKKPYRKPVLAKHGTLSIVEGD